MLRSLSLCVVVDDEVVVHEALVQSSRSFGCAVFVVSLCRWRALVVTSAFWPSLGVKIILISRSLDISKILVILAAICLVLCEKFPVCIIVHSA